MGKESLQNGRAFLFTGNRPHGRAHLDRVALKLGNSQCSTQP